VDCGAGNEWWLAREAQARNPNIRFSALAWGTPGWVGGGDFWTNDTIDYLMRWMDCAKQHNLKIEYLGGWNERGVERLVVRRPQERPQVEGLRDQGRGS
jgi:hypothetical protein